jgi:hypothetical protein
MEKDNNDKKKKKTGFFGYIFGGRIFVSDIITKNALLLGLIIIYSFIYVSNRYEYEHELVEIDRLTKEKNELRNILLTLESEFAYKSRQINIEEFLKTNNSELKISNKAPYKITK